MEKLVVLLFCCRLLVDCAVTLNFNSYDPKNTFEIKGTTSSYFGMSVSNAGDFNKDGFEDLIIGAYYDSGQKGTAYIIYGGKDFATIDLSSSTTTLDPTTTGFKITGNAAIDWLGFSVSSAGDIDNDGYDDIIVGAEYKNSKTGAAYVIYGSEKSSTTNFDLGTVTLDPLTTGFMITGNAANDKLGCSVNSAGDVNKDGYDDIIVGAISGGNTNGVAYVIYGGPRSSMSNIDFGTTTLDPLTTGFMIKGNAAGDSFGCKVDAGDVNNDGYSDLIIGASTKKSNWIGAAYVIYGGEKSSLPNIDLSTQTLDPATTGFMVMGNAGFDRLGYALSSAGDINKDGYDDIIIGAYGRNNKQGVAYVIYGGKKSDLQNIDLSTQTLDPATTGFMIIGNAVADWFGDAVSSAGDINLDGYCDIVIGASLKSSNFGAAYVIYGGPKSSMSNIDLSSSATTLDPAINGFMISGTTAGQFGNSVSSIDVNNDGLSDLIIAAFMENKAYVISYNQCPSNCDHCPSSTSKCKTCSLRYGLDSQELCEACASADCDTCNADYTVCETCISPYLVYSGDCVFSCPVNTFMAGTTCTDCPLGCSSCTSSSSCQGCIAGYELVGLECKKVGPIETKEEIEEKGSEKAAAGVFEGASIIGALNSGSSLPLNFGLVAKILRNIKYMNLPVSRELYETFYSWKVASGFLSAPEGWSLKYSSKTIPVVFSRYKLQSAFLINFWKPLMMTLIGIGAFGIFKLIEVSINDKKSRVCKISKQVNVAASNFALTQFYSNLDDVLFYFTLEMRSTKFETAFRVCSSILAIVLFLAGAVFMISHSQLLGRYQKLKKMNSTPQLEDFVAKFMNINLIFKDFKDTNSLTQSFLMINVGRSVLSSLIYATLFEYPMIQISFLIVLNFLMIVYLWNLKSFQEFTNTCGQMFCELVLFTANICVFLLALFDHAEAYPLESIERLGKCIIVLNFILLFGSALLILVNIGKMLYQAYKKKPPRQGVQHSLTVSEKALPAKFTRPGPIQSNQDFSTNAGLSNDPQRGLQSQSALETPISTGSLPNQQGVSRNYSIHHPARNQQLDGFEIPNSTGVLHSKPIEDSGDVIQPKKRFPRSRLLINREITAARIAQFSKKENNSNYGIPQNEPQDSSFHSWMPLNQDSSMNQDVSFANFD